MRFLKVNNKGVQKMIESKILKKLERASIEERILVIEAILQTVKNEMRSTSSKKLSQDSPKPLKGKLVRYNDPYESVAEADWEAL
jgi:hypothetical protein